MHWLVILLLVGFAIRQGLVLKRIEDRLDAALRASDERRRAAVPPVATPAEPARPAPTPVPRPMASVAEVRRPATVTAPEPRKPDPAPVPPRAAPRPPVSTWLAENGLAWIGGGGLALGGLLLVVYAAQQGVFTPPFRIAAAVVLGVAMIAASEWILRQIHTPGGRHLLAAAVAAGAGAVTLYGAVCAAYTLYALIPFAAAAVLTGAISLGLLGLALRHGEPLALLAIFGAVITPWVTGISAWSPTVLVSWVLLIGVTGYVIGAARMWTRASLVTLGGLLAWSLAEAFGGGALLLLAATGPACAVLWRRASRRDDPADPRHRTFLQLPAIALVVTSLVSAHLWFNGFEGAADLPQAVLIAGALVALGAAIVGRGMAPAMVFAAPVGVAVIGALPNLVFFSGRPEFGSLLPWFYGLTGLIPVAALAGALRSPAPARTTLLGVGGVGVAVLASVSWLLLDWVEVTLSWLPAALLGAAMFATAGLIARRVEQALTDRGLVFWLAAAAELSFLAIHAAIPAAFEPVAFALAALLLAFAAHRLAWAGLARAGVAGGLVALAVMFHPDFIGAALAGQLSLPFALGVSFAASALLFAAARMMRGPRAPNRTEAEAQSTAALMVLLTGLFIGLHVILSGTDPEAASGGLFEGGLRTVVLLGAGLLLVVRQREDHGPLARGRTLAVVGAGLVHGLLVQGLVWNPWWGAGAAPLGLPVINTLMISFLAPAVLLAASAGRRRPTDDWTRIWAAAAIAFAFLWIVLVLRHLFQGAAMGEAGIGRAEGCAYAVLLLLTARLFARQGLGTRVGLGDALRRAAVPLGWAALAFAVLTFGLLASPWWGPQTAPLASVPAALLLFGLYALGAAAMAGLRSAPGALGQAATAVAVGILFALMTLLIRWGFHGGAMAGVTPGGGLETWTFSALWAVFGLATLCLGTARHDVAVRWAGLVVLLFTAAKVLFFDLARLEGVTRAASFLAVGALFLAGALVARRLNTRNPDAGSS
jgi:uncharacterized membrane protein